jgi:thiamine biosynthesis lipoprotein
MHRTGFAAIGSTHEVLCTVAASLPRARSIAEALLADLDAAASRFHDSELDRLNRVAFAGPVEAGVSGLLAEVLSAALHAAAATDGLNDPTVGAGLVASGYDVDIDLVRARDPGDWASLVPAPGPPSPPDGNPGWREVRLRGRQLTLPAGILLDVGSIGKAYAADAIAARCAAELPGGFVVNCGGDIALAGPLPGGVPLGVVDADGAVLEIVELHSGGMATSSTRLRRWQRLDRPMHHIIDPRTGEPATPVWHTVTVTAATAVVANAASTAAVVLGEEAPAWLARRGLHTLLVGADGRTTRVGWPAPEEVAA